MIEKILAVDEALEPTLPVAGTTGYDVLREVGGLFVDPQGAPALTALVESAGMDYAAAPTILSELKIRSATETLASELRRLRRSIVAAAGTDHPQLPEAVAALLTHIGVYRCDYPGLAAIMPTALAETQAESPELEPALQVLAAALARGGEPATRLQQLCGAVTAKSVEDCYFYRDARLVSLNEVGGEPHRFGVGAAEFHHSAATRARMWPEAMTTLTTHDTKRGEDVRARIGVLSQVPSLWTEFLARWEIHAPSPDPATGQFLWQNIFGVWPISGKVTDALRDRLHAYTEKAIREASWHTTWNDPDAAFEGAVHRWLDTVLDGPVAGQLTELVAQLNPHAASDALGQKLLALTVPGDARCLPGHRAVGRQPGRPGQPPAGRLRRAAGGAGGDAPSEDAGCHDGIAAAARSTGRFPRRQLRPRACQRRRRRTRRRVPARRRRPRRGDPLDRPAQGLGVG